MSVLSDLQMIEQEIILLSEILGKVLKSEPEKISIKFKIEHEKEVIDYRAKEELTYSIGLATMFEMNYGKVSEEKNETPFFETDTDIAIYFLKMRLEVLKDEKIRLIKKLRARA